MRRFLIAVLWLALSTTGLFGQTAIVRVFADQAKRVHVVDSASHETVVAGERGQVGIDSVQISADGQVVGWLALFKDPDNSSPYAGILIVWRDGKVLRRFATDQTLWSWAFAANTAQVAYHTGSTHGESASHCELRDIANGRRLASWDGDLDDPKRPEWTKGLDH